MAINVDVRIGRPIPNTNEEGTVLVILNSAGIKSGNDNPVRIDSVRDILDKLNTVEVEDETFGAQELLEIEYLVKAGLKVLAYKPLDPMTEDELDRITDNLLYNYRFVHMADFELDVDSVEGDTKLVVDILNKKNVEVYLQADLSADIPNSLKVPKVSLFNNYGIPGMRVDTGGNLDKGIPTGLAVMVRKAYMLREGTPWEPIAGETNGVLTEFVNLKEQVGNVEKTKLQNAGINPAILKPGVGAVVVAQNTGNFLASDVTPLAKGHITTTALDFKRKLELLGEKYLFKINNLKTWIAIEADANTILRDALNSGAIINTRVAAGLGKTMTQEDINEGKLILNVAYTPINAIEEINVVLTIIEGEGDFIIETDGGI